MKNSELTKAERKLIDNFCADAPRGKEFGQLKVRKYCGFNSALLALNGTAKTIGVVQYVKSEGVWYMDAINGERYRFPETKNGLFGDENGEGAVLDVEFKRNDV